MRDLTEIEQLPILTRGGVTLRPWRADHAGAVAAICDDDEVIRWLPAMPNPYTLADGEEWVGNAERKWRELRWANFAVEDAETGRLAAPRPAHRAGARTR